MSEEHVNAFFRYWLPWYAYLAAIFTLSCFPRPDEILRVSLKDYWIHPLEYLFLPALTFRAFLNSQHFSLRDRYRVTGILFCFFYAATDEFHQSFVPHRVGSLDDLLFDGIGIVLGAVLYQMWKAKRSHGTFPA